MSATYEAAQRGPTFLGHPVGLYICFGTELWERFSFYGLKYLLVLYLTKYHLFSDGAGLEVLGAYAGLAYASPVIGGMLADRYLGMRKAVTYGGLLLVLGHLGMAYEGTQAYVENGEIIRDAGALQVFYFSLALVITGVGFLKPNISTIVGQLYAPEDTRRDPAFTIFYMGINIGSFSATMLCGWLGETYGWKYGFGAAGVGMLAGLLWFIWGQRFLYGAAEPHDPDMLRKPLFGPLSREWLIYAGGAVGVVVIWQLMQIDGMVHGVLNTLGLGFLLWFGWFVIFRCDATQRSRMIVLVTLTICTVVFWALFEQSSASMTLYADRVLDREAFGITFTAVQIGSLNAFFIMTVAPFVALIWQYLGRKGLEPSTPVKFALGIAQAGLGFGMLVYGAQHPDEFGKVALVWMVLAYFFHTTGELCLSPVGLSAVTKLSVPSVVSVMMGAWFLATAYAEYVAALIAKLASVDTSGGEITDISVALGTYTELFTKLFWIGIGFGLVLLVASPLLRRGMRGIH